MRYIFFVVIALFVFIQPCLAATDEVAGPKIGVLIVELWSGIEEINGVSTSQLGAPLTFIPSFLGERFGYGRNRSNGGYGISQKMSSSYIEGNNVNRQSLGLTYTTGGIGSRITLWLNNNEYFSGGNTINYSSLSLEYVFNYGLLFGTGIELYQFDLAHMQSSSGVTARIYGKFGVAIPFPLAY